MMEKHETLAMVDEIRLGVDNIIGLTAYVHVKYEDGIGSGFFLAWVDAGKMMKHFCAKKESDMLGKPVIINQDNGAFIRWGKPC